MTVMASRAHRLCYYLVLALPWEDDAPHNGEILGICSQSVLDGPSTPLFSFRLPLPPFPPSVEDFAIFQHAQLSRLPGVAGKKQGEQSNVTGE